MIATRPAAPSREPWAVDNAAGVPRGPAHAIYAIEATDTLNFVVTGEVRSGAAVVQSSIDRAPRAVCHADLLHHKAAVRARCHTAYFGPGEDGAEEWYVPQVTNPYQYLAHRVFDGALHGEAAVGLRVLYPQVRELELYDLFQSRAAAGSFCLVHVVRNPVACYVSLQQARRSRVWSRGVGEAMPAVPAPVTVGLDDLVPFVRDHYSVRAKIDRSCDDRIVVNYRDLFYDFMPTMRAVYRFLELPAEWPARATRCRLRNRPIRERIANFEALRRTAPADIRELLDAKDLF